MYQSEDWINRICLQLDDTAFPLADVPKEAVRKKWNRQYLYGVGSKKGKGCCREKRHGPGIDEICQTVRFFSIPRPPSLYRLGKSLKNGFMTRCGKSNLLTHTNTKIAN